MLRHQAFEQTHELVPATRLDCELDDRLDCHRDTFLSSGRDAWHPVHSRSSTSRARIMLALGLFCHRATCTERACGTRPISRVPEQRRPGATIAGSWAGVFCDLCEAGLQPVAERIAPNPDSRLRLEDRAPWCAEQPVGVYSACVLRTK